MCYNPSMPLEAVTISEFHGGLNFVDPQDELESHELGGSPHVDTGFYYSQNIEVPPSGKMAVARRPWKGVGHFNGAGTLPVGTLQTDLVSNFTTFRNADTNPDKVIFSNGKGLISWIEPNVNTPTVVELLAAASTPEYEFQQAQDVANVQYVWCMNGTSTPQKYNMVSGLLSAWAGTPPNGKTMCTWKNMMIIAGVAAQPQRLYFSAIANPESWLANNFIDIKSVDDEVDYIVAVVPIGEQLLVFKSNSVWLVFDPVTFDNRRVGTVGCVSRNCTAKSIDKVYWLGRDGVYSTDGEDIFEESKRIKPIFVDQQLQATYGAISSIASNVTYMTMGYDNRLYLWKLNTPYCWVLDLNIVLADKQSPWFLHTMESESRKFVAMVRLSYQRHVTGGPQFLGMWGSTTLALAGAIQEFYDAFTDRYEQDNVRPSSNYSTPIVTRYVSRWMPIQGIENKERIRRVNFVLRGQSYGFLMYVDMAPGGSTAFADVTPVDVQTLTMMRFRPEVRGRFFRVVVVWEHSFAAVLQRGELHSIEMKYRGGKEH